MISDVVTPEDYLAGHRLGRRRITTWLNVALVVFAFGGLLLLVSRAWAWGTIVICGAMSGLVGEFVQSHFFFPRKVRRLYAQLKLAGPVTFTWDAETLQGQSSAGHFQRKWKDYVALKEDDEVFLLYITDYLFEIIPKRWFRDAGQLEEFRTHASTAGGGT